LIWAYGKGTNPALVRFLKEKPCSNELRSEKKNYPGKTGRPKVGI